MGSRPCVSNSDGSTASLFGIERLLLLHFQNKPLQRLTPTNKIYIVYMVMMMMCTAGSVYPAHEFRLLYMPKIREHAEDLLGS
jgi:hypothetical protein